MALQDLCLAVRHGERLGLLGANGAGKTTILGILTQQVLATAGDAFVQGESILETRGSNGGPRLGYCPQADPLLLHMTAVEQLSMFARLKGVPKDDVRKSVCEILRRVTISEEMSRRPAVQYSGGSKRKLALGIALVGGVSAFLLDEPSSGMVTCQTLLCHLFWNVILMSSKKLLEGCM